jgi:hypothetical protein
VNAGAADIAIELLRLLDLPECGALAPCEIAPSPFPMHESGVPERFADFLSWLDLSPSPVITAICDASEGRLIELDDALCQSTFGCGADALPKVRRRTAIVRAGGRAGKTSRILAPKAIHAALTTPLPTLGHGEHAWALIVSITMREALQCLSFVKGYLASRPELRRLVVNGEDGEDDEVGTKQIITLRRPHDGKLVDIRVGAATRGGVVGRGKTLVCALLDEAEFFLSDERFVATDRQIYQAAIQRIVPGGQAWLVSTPWIEGYGVMEELFGANWGSHERALCASGPTRALNPTWDPNGEIERDMRANDPDNAAREIDAIPLAAGTKLFFTAEALKACVDTKRTENLLPMTADGAPVHYAGTDLGFRRNSAALALAREESVATKDGPKAKVRVVWLEENRPAPGAKLKPSEVCTGFGKKCQEYRCGGMLGDYHYVDSAHEYLSALPGPQVQYLEASQKPEDIEERFTKFRTLMSEEKLDLPNHARLLVQMRLVVAKPMPGGAVKIILPTIAGAHGDLLGAVVNAAVQVPLGKAPMKAEASGGKSKPASMHGQRAW